MFSELEVQITGTMGGSDSIGNPCKFASTLEEDLNQYLMASLSLNSKRTYSSGEKRFLQFCGHLKHYQQVNPQLHNLQFILPKP